MSTRSLRIDGWLRLALLGLIVTSAGDAAAHAASPSLLLLNGNTGNPMPGVPLFLSPVCGMPCVYPKSPWRVTSDATGKLPIPELADLRFLQVMVATTDYMYCQDSGAHNLRPINPDRFDWIAIRQAGVVAPNRCNGHLHVLAEPGQLVFYLRPLTWWEKLSKPPGM